MHFFRISFSVHLAIHLILRLLTALLSENENIKATDPNYKQFKKTLCLSSTIQICGEMRTRIFYLKRDKSNYISNVSQMVVLRMVTIRSQCPSNEYLETLLPTAPFLCGMSCCSPKNSSFRYFMSFSSSRC